jgi:purine nucleosidase
MAARVPVLLDTDTGSNVDDAVALAYLLRQPQCELVGITTVSGDVAKRCACADAVCRGAGRDDVPIHAGASDVLLIGPGQCAVPHYAAIEHLPHRRGWPSNTAVDFLRRTIRGRPGELTLLTIGPLTNIALLFAIDPEAPRLLKSMVSMAGIYFGPPDKREWNCTVDPIAAAMVFAARPPRHACYGLDVTRQCGMGKAEVTRRFSAAGLEAVARMAEAWFAQTGREDMAFNDPLAAACVLRPELCSYARGTVAVSIGADVARSGFTIFSPASGGEPGPHQVAQSVDAAAFLEEYFGVVLPRRQ